MAFPFPDMAQAVSQLTQGAKEGLKSGLAVSGALGIAYAMGWSEPAWAGLSAMVVHLGPAGASTQKGLNRIAGTLLSAVVAVVLLAFFSQQRWGFMLAMSAWLSFAGYKSFTSKHSYMWMKAALVTLLLVVHSDLDSLNSFNVLVSRSQTTILGVIVHYFVDTFLWPHRTRPAMLAAIQGAMTLQNDITRDFFTEDYARRGKDAVSPLPRLFIKDVARFTGLAEQCLLEDQRTIEERHAWRHIVHVAKRMIEVQGHISHAIKSYGGGNPLLSAFEGQEAFLAEMNARAARLKDLFARGQGPSDSRRSLNRARLALSDRAMAEADATRQRLLVILLTQLNELEDMHAQLSALLEDIFCLDAPLPRTSPASDATPALDPEAARLTLCLVAMFCFLYLMNIYTTFPSGAGGIYITMLFMLQAILSPRVQPKTILPSFVAGSALALIFYVFVFPNITEFYQLSLWLTASFCLSWMLIQKQLGKWPCILMVIYCEGVLDLTPTYDFQGFLNMMATLFIFFVSSYVLTELIFSLRPERLFLNQNRWYYAAAAYRIRQITVPDAARAKPSPFSGGAGLSPMVLARRMDNSAARIDPRRVKDFNPRAMSEYIDAAHLLAVHLASLRDDYVKIRANQAFRGYMVTIDRHLDELRRILESFPRLSYERIAETARGVVSSLAEAASGPAGSAAPETGGMLALKDIFRFNQSVEIVAENMITAKRLHEDAHADGLEAARF